MAGFRLEGGLWSYTLTMSHLTTARNGRVEELIRGSRFLGYARSVSSSEEAEALLAELREEHSGASHHCWAYRIGEEMRFSDDGEPGGTAGRPILEVVLKRGLDHLVVVVVRYFGGTRLGAGGLVRAYSGTAAKALDLAGERLVEDTTELQVHVPFALVDSVHRLLGDTRKARTTADSFDPEGWRFELELPAREALGFRERLAELTRGSARVDEQANEG